MEATGAYWRPFWHVLAGMGLNVMLVNARSVRQIPRRKSDVADSVWLADLGAHGLVRPSFVPPALVGELKDLVRARTLMARERGQVAQRLEKMLESSVVKISGAISDLMGVSGRRMLEALIARERDPETLAGLADRRIRASREELGEALTGRFTDHHAFMARILLDTYDHYTAQIAKLDERIGAFFDPGEPGSGRPEVSAC
jgi:transposase